jgi:hypothetical protein
MRFSKLKSQTLQEERAQYGLQAWETETAAAKKEQSELV